MKRILAGMLIVGACAAAQAGNLFLKRSSNTAFNNTEYTAPIVIRKQDTTRQLSAREQKIVAEYNQLLRERRYVLAQAQNAEVITTPPPKPAADVVAPPVLEMPLLPVAEVPLFTNVRYKDHDEMAPCATKKVIEVRNPCKRCCTDPECVLIEICVPTCACEQVKSRWGGRRVRYDYGKYAVDVRVKHGYIEVDYQD